MTSRRPARRARPRWMPRGRLPRHPAGWAWWLLRLAGRCWRVTVPLLAVGYARLRWGSWPIAVAVVLTPLAVGLTVWIGLRRRNGRSPRSADGHRRPGQSSHLRVARQLRADVAERWDQAARKAGLAESQQADAAVPELRHLKARKDGTVTAHVPFREVGVDVEVAQQRAAKLANLLGCRSVSVDELPDHYGEALLTFARLDTLAAGVLPSDLPPTTKPLTVTFGLHDNATPAQLSLRTSILGVGLSGGGKSSFIWALLADMQRQRIPVRLWVVDPKRTELRKLAKLVGRPGAFTVARYETDPGTPTADMIAEMRDRMRERQADQDGRQHEPSLDQPLDVLLIDETLQLGDNVLRVKDKDGNLNALGDIVTNGRASSTICVALAQLAQVDALGRLRDAIPQRVCFATNSAELTGAALGDKNAEALGARCSRIGLGNPGVGFMWQDGVAGYRRFRCAHYTDKAVDRIVADVPAATEDLPGELTYLYVAWGENPPMTSVGDPRPLYVGISNSPGRRDFQHGRDHAWWAEVDTVKWHKYPSRPLARAAEADFTRVLKPVYPKVNNGEVLREARRAVAPRPKARKRAA